jgi:glucoamylase
MVWCRDGGETALALAAAGHTDDAATALAYLAGRQRQDGSWPRCFFVSRVPAAFDPQAAVQLDEVAFPLLLAGKLDELGVPMPEGADNAVTSAAGYLARNGPVSTLDVDRWEENAGASPFTIGLEIVAMLVAATRLTGPDRTLALALADNWNERLEEFTFVAGDEIDQAFGTDGHYVRLGLSGGGRVDLRNQPQDTQPVSAAALVGLEFGYLPRLGLRDPADKRVTDTLAIVEAMLGADTPSGRAYHRYDVDGYGEWLDGSGWPLRTFGIGRPWPLLAGERGHLDVLAGGDARTQLQAMLAMRGRGGLLPEQIWDADPLPWQNLRPGQPTGSAMPLAWAHSELIKLAVAVATGKPVELLALVSDRYRAMVPASQAWFWRDASPVQALPAGRALVVADLSPFTLHYGFDDWDPATITERDAGGLGLGLFGVTLTPADLAGRASLQFVRRYADGRWEGATRHDVALGAPGPATLRLSAAHLGRLAAAGGG